MATQATRESKVPAVPAVLLATLTLTGCMTLGPDYQRPDVSPPADFKSHVEQSEASSIADLPWWEVFDDKVLQGLINQAVVGNYDLQVAVARIEQARARVGIAQADLYPQVGYDVNAARTKAFNPLTPKGNIIFNSFGLSLNSAWELDLWGRIRRSTESARAALFAQEANRRGVLLLLVSEVATNYFLLIELDRELVIARDSAEAYKQTLDLFTRRFQAGRDSKLGVVRAQAAYDSSLATIATLNRAIAQQENVLSVLLGAYPREIARGVRLVDQKMPDAPIGMTTDILQRRPDILQAEQVMVGANADIGVAMANFFPRIGLSALLGTQAQDTGSLFEEDSSIWQIAGGLAGPIFQGGRLRESYRAQQAFWDQTLAQYKQTVIGAFRETSDALIAQQTLVAQRTALESQVNALNSSVELAKIRYDTGRSSYFEVLDAQLLLYQAAATLAQTQRDQLIAVVNLYKALGGGWNVSDEQWAHTP